jgi:hypothetical protein
MILCNRIILTVEIEMDGAGFTKSSQWWGESADAMAPLPSAAAA